MLRDSRRARRGQFARRPRLPRPFACARAHAGLLVCFTNANFTASPSTLNVRCAPLNDGPPARAPRAALPPCPPARQLFCAPAKPSASTARLARGARRVDAPSTSARARCCRSYVLQGGDQFTRGAAFTPSFFTPRTCAAPPPLSADHPPAPHQPPPDGAATRAAATGPSSTAWRRTCFRRTRTTPPPTSARGAPAPAPARRFRAPPKGRRTDGRSRARGPRHRYDDFVADGFGNSLAVRRRTASAAYRRGCLHRAPRAFPLRERRASFRRHRRRCPLTATRRTPPGDFPPSARAKTAARADASAA